MVRRLVILLFPLVILASCKDATTDGKSESSTSPQPSETQVAGNPFAGTWAIQAYIDTLIQTKSPNKSQPAGYFIKLPASLSDTGFSFTNHEGGDQYTVVKYGAAYFLKSCSSTDSIKIELAVNGTKLILKNDTFLKVKEHIGIPEDVLFKGEYRYNNGIVQIQNNGSITGLDSAKYYYVENDNIGPGMDNIDIIYLGYTKSEHTPYIFNFANDTLYIYTVKCMEKDENNDCLDQRKGKLKYKLIRK